VCVWSSCCCCCRISKLKEMSIEFAKGEREGEWFEDNGECIVFNLSGKCSKTAPMHLCELNSE